MIGFQFYLGPDRRTSWKTNGWDADLGKDPMEFYLLSGIPDNPRYLYALFRLTRDDLIWCWVENERGSADGVKRELVTRAGDPRTIIRFRKAK
jgi:hypothetical protein